jgi:hypothetical protein
MIKKIVAACTVLFAACAIVIGAGTLIAATSTPVEAKRCGPCPLYCIGVTCDDGKTYCNSCLAACAGAGHCVITG